MGIDPGLARTGVGVIACQGRQMRMLEVQVIRSSADQPLAERLVRIHRGVREAAARLAVQSAAIEAVYMGRNARSALALGHARCAALLGLALEGIPVGEYAPAMVKRAVGAGGRAGKEQVQALVRMLLGGLQGPLPEDAADALAVALCHINRDGGGR